MKTSFANALRSVLCLVLALCLVAGMCPAAMAVSTGNDSFLDADKEEITAKLLSFLQEFWPKVDDEILNQEPVSYEPKADASYVALGDASAYGENNYVTLLAQDLGIENVTNLALKDLRLVDETYAVIDANAGKIAEADIISLGYSAHVFLSNAVGQTLNSFGSSADYIKIDWVGLLGEAYAADVKVLLADMRSVLESEGITGKKADLIVSIVETSAYSATVYAVHLPELIATIREYNMDAVIVVTGMYNPIEEVSIALDGSDVDMTSYMDMVLEAAGDHAADCCATTPNALFVPTSRVETVCEANGDELNVNVNNPMSLVPFASAVRQKMIPSAAGHKYIKNRILQHLVPTFRVAGGNRFETSFLVADHLKASLDVKRFDSVIIANGIDFADALSGSYLAGVKGAPILLSFNDEYNKLAVEYIQANLAEDGIVYILGGEKAVPKSVDKALSGYAVKRLAGANRFETNLLILKEVGVGNKDILVCTGTNFADSLAASATGLPILLVYNNLFDSQKGFLSTLGGQNNFRVIGGTSAVSEKLETSVSIYGETDRVFGTNRISTSVAIANEFFSETDKIVLASAANYPDGLCGGSLACSMGAPLLLTMERFETPIAEYVSGNEISKGMILGGQSAVSDAAADASFAK